MKLKRLMIATACVISGLTAHSQQKEQAVNAIDAAQLSRQGVLKGKDIVITDASLDKYVGTWVGSDGVNSIKINFVKQIHHYGSHGNILDMDILTGNYEFSKNGKVIASVSDKDMSGSSGGKKDTVNIFMDIQSRKSQVALLVIYLPNHTLKLEVEKDRFEFKNDKNFELTEPIILIKQ